MQIQRASVSSRCSTRARCFHQSAARPRAQIQTRFRKKAGREIRRDGQKKKQNERKKHTRWEHSSEWQYRGVCASSRRAILAQSYIYGLFSCKLPFWNRIGSILFFYFYYFITSILEGRFKVSYLLHTRSRGCDCTDLKLFTENRHVWQQHVWININCGFWFRKE